MWRRRRGGACGGGGGGAASASPAAASRGGGNIFAPRLRVASVASREGHQGCVNTVSWSPDGLHLASGSDDTAVCIWRFAQKTTTATTNTTTAGGDDDHDDDEEVAELRRLWASTGVPLPHVASSASASASAYASVSGQNDGVGGGGGGGAPRQQRSAPRSLSAAAARYQKEEAPLSQAQWQLELAAKLLPGHSRNLFAAEFSPGDCGRRLVSTGLDGQLRVSDVERLPGLQLRSAAAASSFSSSPSSSPSAGASSPSSVTQPSSASAGRARVATGSRLLGEFDHSLFRVVFVPDAPDCFLTTHQDGCVRLWDLREKAVAAGSGGSGGGAAVPGDDDTRHMLFRLTRGARSIWGGPSDGPCNTVAFAPDGVRLAMGGGDPYVRVADVRVASQWDGIDRAAYSPDLRDSCNSQRLLGRICPQPILDGMKRARNRRFAFGAENAFVTSVAWSHGPETAMWDTSVRQRSGGGDLLINYSTDDVYLIDTEPALARHAEHCQQFSLGSDPTAASSSPSSGSSDEECGRDSTALQLAVGSDFTLAYTGRRNVQTFLKEAHFVLGGGYVATGCDSGNILLWDRATAKCIQVLKADGSVVNSIAPHPSLPVMAVSGIDSSVKTVAPAPHVHPLRLEGDEEDLPELDGYSRKARRILKSNQRQMDRRRGTPAGDGGDDGSESEDDDDDEGGLGGIPVARLFAMLARLQAEARAAGVQTESDEDEEFDDDDEDEDEESDRDGGGDRDGDEGDGSAGRALFADPGGDAEDLPAARFALERTPAEEALSRADELRTTANAQFRNGAWAEAATAYTDILDSTLRPAIEEEETDEDQLARLNRSRLLILQNRAAAYLRLELFEDCVRDCDCVIAEAGPGVNTGKVRYRRGIAHTRLGNLERAGEDLSEARAAFPGDAAVERAWQDYEELRRQSDEHQADFS